VSTPALALSVLRDIEHRLTHDVDAWVASASVDGAPYLVPLSSDWDGEALLAATPTDSPTGRNLGPLGLGWAAPAMGPRSARSGPLRGGSLRSAPADPISFRRRLGLMV
jgi:hypothetical protein